MSGFSLQVYDVNGAAVNLPHYNLAELAWESYRRKSIALGGDFSARFTLTNVDAYLLEEIFADWLGYTIQEIWDSRVAFSGMVYAMRYSDDGDVLVHTLADMYNNIASYYQANSGVSKTLSSFTSNSDSVAKFGTRTLIISPDNYIAQTAAEQRRDAKLAQVAFPRIRVDNMGPFVPQSNILDVEVIGWVRTLDWQLVNSSSTSTDNANTAISNMLSSYADHVTEGDLATNTTQITREADYQGVWRRIKDIAQTGDGGDNRWLAGCYQGSALNYFEVDETVITYYRKTDYGRRVVLDSVGNEVPDALVLPGRVVFNQDLLTGRHVGRTLINDPRAAFVEAVEYSKDGLKMAGSELEGQDARANSLRMAMQAQMSNKMLRQLNRLPSAKRN